MSPHPPRLASDLRGARDARAAIAAGPTVPGGPPPAPPERLAGAVASLAAARLRPEAAVRDAPPPARIAPFSHAVTVEVGATATGRLVYLHDPGGQPTWAGLDRLVVFARTDVDPAMASDPLLAEVVWTWLTEALAADACAHAALGGTVTTTVSQRFGSLAQVEPAQEAELRCSWTPLSGAAPGGAGLSGADQSTGSSATDLDLAPHLEAFIATIAAMAGMPPFLPGVSTLR